MLRCSAIVVTYNSAAAIGPCLEALTREDCDIIVVDNASQDDTVRRVEEFVAWHPVRLIANEQNRGFGTAVNQGVREAGGVFMLPTYLFIFCLLGLIAFGVWNSIPMRSPSPEPWPHCFVASTRLMPARSAVPYGRIMVGPHAASPFAESRRLHHCCARCCC